MIKIEPIPIDGAFLVTPIPFVDDRGKFLRLVCEETFDGYGLVSAFPQVSVSHNPNRGTLRGMHFQTHPTSETKLVTCVMGRVYDVIVDLRQNSNTYLTAYGKELVGAQCEAIYAPKGCAHGFLTLENNAMIEYHIDQRYSSTNAAGFRWDDPLVAINWPIDPIIMSERDQNLPPLSSLIKSQKLPM